MFDDIRKPAPQDPNAARGGRRKKKEPTPRIRHQNPKVAQHVARVALKHALDMPAAVKEIVPEATPAQAKKLADTLEASPTVQEAVKAEIEAAGLDEDSRNAYVKELWNWYRLAQAALAQLTKYTPGTEQHKAALRQLEIIKDFSTTSARILSKAFIAEKDDSSGKPMELRIRGFEEGIKKMVGGGAEEDEEFVLLPETEGRREYDS